MLGDLWRAARPFSWVNTALPFLALAWSVRHGFDPAVVVGLVYFTAPYNLLLYGVNDLYDYESDRLNPRKGGSVEGGLLTPSQSRGLWVAILVTNVPLLVALIWLTGLVSGAALGVTVLAALAYSVPPVRTKVVPFLDSMTSSLHFVLPAVCGGLVAGALPGALPWHILAAFFLWGAASQSLGAIQDVQYDREAGIGSVATALGERRTAIFSFLAYCASVLLVAAEGGYALAAAVALLPYPLLSLSVVASTRVESARRAWRGFLGMNLLVGFLITQILLRAWGADTLSVLVLLSWGSAAGALAVLVNVLLNTWSMRRPQWEGPSPSLSIIVPARDERATIAQCVNAASSQQYEGQWEIIVVDDGSTDGTPTVASEHLRPGDRLLRPGAAPNGWTGKCWAAQCGADVAGGEVLIFLDADTVLSPHALGEIAAALRAQGGGLLSLLTRYLMGSEVERIFMPAFASIQLGFLPIAAMNAVRFHSLASAYGPCMAISRADYVACGGHRALASSDREDIDLARVVASSGLPVRFRAGADLASTRHYRSLTQIVGCWRRTYYAYGGYSLAVALLGMGGIAVVFLLPFATLPLALLRGDVLSVAGSLVALVAIAVERAFVAVQQRQPLRTVLWHPLTWTGTILFQSLGVVDGIRGRSPRWRGRLLRVEAPT